MEFPNIKYNGDVSKFVEAKDNPYEFVMLYKDKEYLEDGTIFDKFVKGCERFVRTHEDYKYFIHKLDTVLGMNFDQVQPKIKSSKGVTVEMHHGPIFTLYDICSIVTDFRLNHGMKVNTFYVAEQVLNDHFDLIIPIVRLCITNHEAVHNGDLFMNVKQAVGSHTKFIDKYGGDFDDSIKYRLYQYAQMCKNNNSFDSGYLDLDHIKKYFNVQKIDF